MEVANGVHLIKVPYHGIHTAVYLIAGRRLVLVDSGEPWAWEECILPYLRRLGRRPDEVDLVILTHGHGDHMRGSPAIREATGTRVMLSRTGLDLLDDPARRLRQAIEGYGEYLSDLEENQIRAGTDYNTPVPPPQRGKVVVDCTCNEGEVIDAAPLRLEVISTPGHSRDSICLYDEAMGILFTGDAVNGEGTTLDDLPIVQDLDSLVASMQRLARLRIELLCPAHPYLPLGRDVLAGPDARRLIEATIDIHARIRRRIMELVGSAGRPLSTAEISGVICADFGPNDPGPLSHGTVRTHLVKLAREGSIIGTRRDRGIFWRLTNGL